jgi:hypothetical protein
VSVQELVRACETCIDKPQDLQKVEQVEQVMRDLLDMKASEKKSEINLETVQKLEEKARDINADFKDLYESNRERWMHLDHLQAQKASKLSRDARLREIEKQQAMKQQLQDSLATKREWQVYQG